MLNEELVNHDLSNGEYHDIIDIVLEKIIPELTGSWVINRKRINDLATVYLTIRQAINGDDLQITYRVHEPFAFTGCVSVFAKKLSIVNPKFFMDLVHLANNIDVSPRTDEVLELVFTFNDLAEKVGK